MAYRERYRAESVRKRPSVNNAQSILICVSNLMCQKCSKFGLNQAIQWSIMMHRSRNAGATRVIEMIRHQLQVFSRCLSAGNLHIGDKCVVM